MITAQKKANKYVASTKRISDVEVLSLMTQLAQDISSVAMAALGHAGDSGKVFDSAKLMHSKACQQKEIFSETVGRSHLSDERKVYCMLNQLYASLALTNAVILIGRLRQSLAATLPDKYVPRDAYENEELIIWNARASKTDRDDLEAVAAVLSSATRSLSLKVIHGSMENEFIIPFPRFRLKRRPLSLSSGAASLASSPDQNNGFLRRYHHQQDWTKPSTVSYKFSKRIGKIGAHFRKRKGHFELIDLLINASEGVAEAIDIQYDLRRHYYRFKANGSKGSEFELDAASGIPHKKRYPRRRNRTGSFW